MGGLESIFSRSPRRLRLWRCEIPAQVFALLLLAGLVLPAGRVQGETEPEARAWIERMSEASSSLSHIGTFVYNNGAAIQSMRIIRRAGPQGFQERLFSLSGVAREVIRDGDQVVCIMSDTRSVLIAKHLPDSHEAAFPASRFGHKMIGDIDISDIYDLSRHRVSERIAGREGVVIDISPKDRYRYGSRLVIDRHTGLLLKSELLSSEGVSLEQFVYTHLDVPESIPDTALLSEISDVGFTRHELIAPRDIATSDRPRAFEDWLVGWLPDGFRLISRSFDLVHPGKNPAEHRIFSDGLASFSLFIEEYHGHPPPMPESAAVGAVNAFSRIEGPAHITVVGDVPVHTVKRVVFSVGEMFAP